MDTRPPPSEEDPPGSPWHPPDPDDPTQLHASGPDDHDDRPEVPPWERETRPEDVPPWEWEGREPAPVPPRFEDVPPPARSGAGDRFGIRIALLIVLASLGGPR